MHDELISMISGMFDKILIKKYVITYKKTKVDSVYASVFYDITKIDSGSVYTVELEFRLGNDHMVFYCDEFNLVHINYEDDSIIKKIDRALHLILSSYGL